MANTRPTEADRRARPQRWLLVVLASLLLHLTAFNWVNGRLGLPSMDESDPEIVTTVMLPPPPAEPLPQPVIQPKPKKVARKRPPAPRPTPEPLPVAEAVAPASAETETAEASTEPVIDIADTIASATSDAAEQAATRYTISPPPSARLQYDVHALNKGQKWYGTGVFQWQAADRGYSLTAEASVTLLFKISVLNSRSEGAINEFGIAPVLYSEQPWRKSKTNTHFRHDEQLISFSASEATYPYHGGEQDRISVIWQLAGIGRGDAAQFVPGTAIDIFVAGTRKAETWSFRVIGEEEIDTPYGRLAAWHVARVPLPGSYEKQIDVWLAPQQDWHPAKVRYTDARGDVTELALSEIEPAAAQHSSLAPEQ